MDAIKKSLKIVIMNQNKMFNEVLEIRRRVTIVENKHEEVIENIWEQKSYLQKKVEMVKKMIGLLDDKIENITVDTESKENLKPVSSDIESKKCD